MYKIYGSGSNSAVLNLVIFTLLFPGLTAASLSAQTNQTSTLLPPAKELQAQGESRKENETEAKALEQEILKEINRVRTDPQGYAAWLKQQQQYYDGILLKLPGEKPIRTNKGLKALQEAIAYLETQQPLPALDSSEKLTATAAAQLKELAVGQRDSNITFGRVTAEAIVMQLVVDDGFPDRRHRQSLLNSDFTQTGVICQADERYDNICAVAYREQPVGLEETTNNAEIAEESPEPEPSPETATLPEPPQPTAPPPAEIDPEAEITTIPEAEPEATATENDATAGEVDVIEAEAATEVETEELETDPVESETTETDVVEPKEATEVETEELEELETETGIAANTDDSRLLEQVKRGVLETGDRIIPDDGSFYDSYPLEGKAGESFIISLESDEFDTFVAIMDAEGNILEQNDDIDSDNSNSRLRVTLPDDGVYSVIVNAYDEGGRGQYILTVRR